MKIFKSRKFYIAVAVVLAVVMTPVLLFVRPSELADYDFEINGEDIGELTGATAALTGKLTGKKNRRERYIRVQFSEAEKTAMFKMFNRAAKRELAKDGLCGVLSADKNLLIWQMEKPLPLGVLPLRAKFYLAIGKGKVQLDFAQVKLGAVSIPSSMLPKISAKASDEVNRDNSAAQLAALLNEVKFGPDGTMEIVIDRNAAMYLIGSLIPR